MPILISLQEKCFQSVTPHSSYKLSLAKQMAVLAFQRNCCDTGTNWSPIRIWYWSHPGLKKKNTDIWQSIQFYIGLSFSCHRSGAVTGSIAGETTQHYNKASTQVQFVLEPLFLAYSLSLWSLLDTFKICWKPHFSMRMSLYYFCLTSYWNLFLCFFS